MSSNIEIEKVCQYCNQPFTAKTFNTRYCSHTCNSRAYKAIKRIEKHDAYDKAEKEKKQAVTAVPPIQITSVKEKEFLTVTETCVLLGISRGTLFRWIKGKLLPTHQHGTKHLIKRTDIDKLFDNGK